MGDSHPPDPESSADLGGSSVDQNVFAVPLAVSSYRSAQPGTQSQSWQVANSQEESQTGDQVIFTTLACESASAESLPTTSSAFLASLHAIAEPHRPAITAAEANDQSMTGLGGDLVSHAPDQQDGNPSGPSRESGKRNVLDSDANTDVRVAPPERNNMSISANTENDASLQHLEEVKNSSMIEEGSQVPVFASGTGSGILGPIASTSGAVHDKTKSVEPTGGNDESHDAQHFGDQSLLDASAIRDTSAMEEGNHSNEHHFTSSSPQSGVVSTEHHRHSLSSAANMTSTPRLLPTTPHMTGTFVSEPQPQPPTTNQIDSSLNASWMESQLISPLARPMGQFSHSNRSGPRSPTPHLRMGGIRAKSKGSVPPGSLRPSLQSGRGVAGTNESDILVHQSISSLDDRHVDISNNSLVDTNADEVIGETPLDATSAADGGKGVPSTGQSPSPPREHTKTAVLNMDESYAPHSPETLPNQTHDLSMSMDLSFATDSLAAPAKYGTTSDRLASEMQIYSSEEESDGSDGEDEDEDEDKDGSDTNNNSSSIVGVGKEPNIQKENPNGANEGTEQTDAIGSERGGVLCKAGVDRDDDRSGLSVVQGQESLNSFARNSFTMPEPDIMSSKSESIQCSIRESSALFHTETDSMFLAGKVGQPRPGMRGLFTQDNATQLDGAISQQPEILRDQREHTQPLPVSPPPQKIPIKTFPSISKANSTVIKRAPLSKNGTISPATSAQLQQSLHILTRQQTSEKIALVSEDGSTRHTKMSDTSSSEGIKENGVATTKSNVTLQAGNNSSAGNEVQEKSIAQGNGTENTESAKDTSMLGKSIEKSELDRSGIQELESHNQTSKVPGETLSSQMSAHHTAEESAKDTTSAVRKEASETDSDPAETLDKRSESSRAANARELTEHSPHPTAIDAVNNASHHVTGPESIAVPVVSTNEKTGEHLKHSASEHEGESSVDADKNLDREQHDDVGMNGGGVTLDGNLSDLRDGLSAGLGQGLQTDNNVSRQNLSKLQSTTSAHPGPLPTNHRLSRTLGNETEGSDPETTLDGQKNIMASVADKEAEVAGVGASVSRDTVVEGEAIGADTTLVVAAEQVARLTRADRTMEDDETQPLDLQENLTGIEKGARRLSTQPRMPPTKSLSTSPAKRSGKRTPESTSVVSGESVIPHEGCTPNKPTTRNKRVDTTSSVKEKSPARSSSGSKSAASLKAIARETPSKGGTPGRLQKTPTFTGKRIISKTPVSQRSGTRPSQIMRSLAKGHSVGVSSGFSQSPAARTLLMLSEEARKQDESMDQVPLLESLAPEVQRSAAKDVSPAEKVKGAIDYFETQDDSEEVTTTLQAAVAAPRVLESGEKEVAEGGNAQTKVLDKGDNGEVSDDYNHANDDMEDTGEGYTSEYADTVDLDLDVRSVSSLMADGEKEEELLDESMLDVPNSARPTPSKDAKDIDNAAQSSPSDAITSAASAPAAGEGSAYIRVLGSSDVGKVGTSTDGPKGSLKGLTNDLLNQVVYAYANRKSDKNSEHDNDDEAAGDRNEANRDGNEDAEKTKTVAQSSEQGKKIIKVASGVGSTTRQTDDAADNASAGGATTGNEMEVNRTTSGTANSLAHALPKVSLEREATTSPRNTVNATGLDGSATATLVSRVDAPPDASCVGTDGRLERDPSPIVDLPSTKGGVISTTGTMGVEIREKITARVHREPTGVSSNDLVPDNTTHTTTNTGGTSTVNHTTTNMGGTSIVDLPTRHSVVRSAFDESMQIATDTAGSVRVTSSGDPVSSQESDSVSELLGKRVCTKNGGSAKKTHLSKNTHRGTIGRESGDQMRFRVHKVEIHTEHYYIETLVCYNRAGDVLQRIEKRIPIADSTSTTIYYRPLFSGEDSDDNDWIHTVGKNNHNYTHTPPQQPRGCSSGCTHAPDCRNTNVGAYPRSSNRGSNNTENISNEAIQDQTNGPSTSAGTTPNLGRPVRADVDRSQGPRSGKRRKASEHQESGLHRDKPGLRQDEPGLGSPSSSSPTTAAESSIAQQSVKSVKSRGRRKSIGQKKSKISNADAQHTDSEHAQPTSTRKSKNRTHHSDTNKNTADTAQVIAHHSTSPGADLRSSQSEAANDEQSPPRTNQKRRRGQQAQRNANAKVSRTTSAASVHSAKKSRKTKNPDTSRKGSQETRAKDNLGVGDRVFAKFEWNTNSLYAGVVDIVYKCGQCKVKFSDGCEIYYASNKDSIHTYGLIKQGTTVLIPKPQKTTIKSKNLVYEDAIVLSFNEDDKGGKYLCNWRNTDTGELEPQLVDKDYIALYECDVPGCIEKDDTAGDSQRRGSGSAKRDESRPFDNMGFLITGAKKMPDKAKLMSDITANGGTIYETVSDIKNVPHSSMNVIAAEEVRTVSYMYGLALALPCVNYKWIDECLKQNYLLSSRTHRLTTGKVTVKGQVAIPLAERKNPVFQDKLVYIKLKTKGDEKKWKIILEAAGAKINTRFNEEEDYVIANDRTNPPHKNRVRARHLDWVVECLILGYLLEENLPDTFYCE